MQIEAVTKVEAVMLASIIVRVIGSQRLQAKMLWNNSLEASEIK
jgi:hypothetical protein